MVAGLQDDKVVTVDEVNEAVLVGDASRPGAGEGVAQLFGFADTGERVAQGVGGEPVDARDVLTVGGEPVGVVGPAVRGEDPSSA